MFFVLSDSRKSFSFLQRSFSHPGVLGIRGQPPNAAETRWGWGARVAHIPAEVVDSESKKRAALELQLKMSQPGFNLKISFIHCASVNDGCEWAYEEDQKKETLFFRTALRQVGQKYICRRTT